MYKVIPLDVKINQKINFDIMDISRDFFLDIKLYRTLTTAYYLKIIYYSI